MNFLKNIKIIIDEPNEMITLIGITFFFLMVFLFFILRILKVRKDNNQLVSENIRLLEDNRTFKEVEKMKSEFITTVAHQVRTPMTRIKWAMQNILSEEPGKINKEQREILKTGYDAGLSMINIINNLLESEKTESTYFGYNFQDVSLEGVASEAINNFLPVAKTKGITIEFLSTKDDIPPVRIDPDKIRLAIGNLIDNAISYTPRAGKITVMVENLGDYAKVSVKDTGIGVPKDAKDKLFTRFFRAKNAVSVKTEGSGLGLYITKNIIMMHGGDIWVESEEGKGTTFLFTVPLVPDNTKQNVEKFIEEI